MQQCHHTLYCPGRQKSLNALIQCYNLIQQGSEPQLPARSNRAVHVHGVAVKGTCLCEVYWLSTSHLLGWSQNAGIWELANSAFLPCWHNVWTWSTGEPYNHLLFAGPMFKPRSYKAVAPLTRTGHKIYTTHLSGKRGRRSTHRSIANRHQCQPWQPHLDTEQLGCSAPQWLAEWTQEVCQAKVGAPTFKGSTCPQVAEYVCSYKSINSGMATVCSGPFPKADWGEPEVGSLFFSVQWFSRREQMRETGTWTHLPMGGMMHQELSGQSTLLFPSETSTAAQLAL